MPSEDDTFPDSEQCFRQAFDHPDAPAKLLKLIKEYPEYMVIIDLVVTYQTIVQENPDRAEELTRTLVAVRNSPDAPIISGDTTLAEIFSCRLAFLHGVALIIDDEKKILGTSNEFLSGSLLSGLSFKYNLCGCSDQSGAILDGLDADPISPISEVLVAGACIQLLVAGSIIIRRSSSYFKSAKKIATRLKAQRHSGTVKDKNAQKLLELAISHAESGFKKRNDIDNAWKILFPLELPPSVHR
ncbi:hypothetical protein BDN70DRAFT_937354 [Pholiota conissans]|uniref:Uncharacterized protein n=1 Tax=Pholiota conissans TaxID=109636 RepID=A0A9P5YPI8_9AGAR|nr:hypothetical protein BDN70DRAFT_937354 [Pholiota conissans]